MAYSRGKYAIFISDRSGLQFPYSEMVTEWNGAKVHTSEWEKKAPQLMPHTHKPDPIALKWARVDRNPFPVANLLPINPFTTVNTLTTVTVNEPNHGRSNNDYVRFRDLIQVVGGISNTAYELSATLATAITADSTEIVLNDTSAFPATGFIVLNELSTNNNVPLVALNETVQYTANNTTTNTLSGLTRGTSAPSYGITYNPTSARSHAVVSPVFGSYIITVIDTNNYSFILNAAYTPTVSEISGGRVPPSAGPVNTKA
jgi:hypothetical protein